MSKVLKVVAIVAVAVAVVVFAPAIGAALASVAGSLGITVAGSVIASYLVGMALTTALTAALTLFRKPPSMSNSMADRLNTSVNPTAPRKIVFGLTAAGNDVRFFETYGKKKDRYAQAIALASHRVNGIRGFYVENDLVWNGGYLVSHGDGIESVRAVTEGRPGNGFNLGSGSFWRSTASFTGCAYIAITWKLSTEAWPSGIPSSSRTIVEGCPLYDPRLDSTRGGSGSHRIDNQDSWAWYNGGTEIGRNPALALLTYLIGWKINGKLVWGMGIPAANIDFDSFKTYANICEEQVATQGGGSVQRYTCDGIFSTADSHDTVINAITAAMGSTKMVDVGGAYTLIGGYDDTAGPKVGLTLDDIVGAAGSSTPYVWVPAPASRERFNIVRGRFADPSNLYQLSDWGDPIEQPALADEVPRTMNLDLGCVSRAETCQRIAKQFLLREYLTPGKFSATFGPNAFAAQVGSIVTLTIPQLGWNGKLFRVEEQAETHDMFYQMTLREESAAIYAWDREEKPLPANIRPTGYDPSDTLSPEAFAVSSQSYQGANNYNVSEVHVSWTPEDSGRVTGIQIYSRPVGVDAWTEQAALHDARSGSFIFTSNAPGIDLEVRARFRMSNAIYGQWVTASVSTAAVEVVDNSARDQAGEAKTAADQADTKAGNAIVKADLADGKATQAVDALKDAQGNVIAIRDMKAVLDKNTADAKKAADEAAGLAATARNEITQAKTDLGRDITDARAEGTTARQEAAQVRADLVPTIVDARKAGTDASAQAGQVRTDLVPTIADAKKAGTDAAAAAGQISTDLANEVTRAKGAEGTLTTKVETAQGRADAAHTAISTETTQRVQGDTALSQRIDTVESTAASDKGTINSRITSEVTTLTNADTALGQRIDSLTTTVNGNTTTLVSETKARSDADTALGQRIDTLTTTVGGNTTAISSEATARSTADGALGQRIDSVVTQANTDRGDYTVKVSAESTARSNADGALGTRIDDVVAQANTDRGDYTAKISDEATARSNADGALASRTASLEARAQGGGNLLLNTAFAGGDYTGWNANGPAGVDGRGVNQPSDEWHPRGDNVLTLHQNGRNGTVGLTSGGAWNISPITVAQNQHYQFYAFVAAHRARVELAVQWYDANGGDLGAAYTGPLTVSTGGRDIEGFTQVGFNNLTAPGGATFATLWIAKWDTSANESDSWMWFLRPYAGSVRADQTAWNPYVAGDSSAAVRSTALAKIADEATTRASADGAISNRVQTIEADYTTNGAAANIAQAKVNDEATARSNADGALSNRIQTIEADYTTNGAAASIAQAKVNDEATARANADGALTNRTSGLETRLGSQENYANAINAKVDTNETASVNRDTAIATRATTLESKSTYLNEQIAKAFPGFETRETNWGFDTQQSGRNQGAGWEANHVKGAGISFGAGAIGSYLYMDPNGWIKTTPGKRYRAGFWVWQWSAPNGYGGAARVYWEGHNAAHTEGAYLGSTANPPEATQPFYGQIPNGAWHCYASDLQIDDNLVSSSTGYWVRPRINIDGCPANAGYVIAGWFFREVTGEYDNAAKISDEATTRSNQDSALANRISSTEAKLNGTEGSWMAGRIVDEATASTNRDGALGNRLNTIEATVYNGPNQNSTLSSRITDEATASANRDSALANRASALEARQTNSGNLVANTAFATTEGWFLNYAPYGATLGRNGAGATWQIGGVENNLTLYQPGPGNGFQAEALSDKFAVLAGEYYQVQCLTASHRSRAWVSLFFYDGNGNGTGYAGENSAARINAGNQDILNHDITGAKCVQAPPGTVFARMGLRQYDVSNDGYCWFHRPYVGIVKSNTTEWNAYSPGSDRTVTAQTLARISTEETTRANADGALSSRIGSIEADYVTNGAAGNIAQARVNDEAVVRSNADSALSGRTGTLEAQVAYQQPSGMSGAIANVDARVTNEESARAGGDNALATRANALEATVSGISTSAVPNDKFANWPNASGMPTAWVTWNSQGNYRTERWAASMGSPYSIRTLNDVVDVESGFYQTIKAHAGKWVCDVTVQCVGNSLSGAGVTLHGQYNIDFLSDPDTNGLTGDQGDLIRSWTKAFDLTQDFINSIGGNLNVHAMVGWTGFGRTRVPKYVQWYRLSLRPASPGDIAGVKNAQDIVTTTARIATEESARAGADNALATRTGVVEAQVSNDSTNLLRNSIFNAPGWGVGSGGPPPGWGVWAQDNGAYIGAYNGRSNYGAAAPVQIDRNGDNNGVNQNIGTQAAGWYVLEVDITAEDGNWTGCGVHINFNNGYSRNFHFGSEADTNGGVVAGNIGNVNRKFSTMFYNGAVGNNTMFYLMAGWSGFASGQGFLRTIWHKAVVRPASDAEIKAQKVMDANIIARVTSNEGAVANIQTKVATAWSEKTVSAGTSAATITMRATDDNGNATSDVTLAASRIALRNTETGGISKGGMVMSGGNAVFDGSITANGGILVGNGKLRVQVQATDYAVSHNQRVDFGYDLGRAPTITFGPCPVALNSGEVYAPYASDLSATGFTAQLVIQSAPQSSGQSTGNFVNQGNNTWDGAKQGKPNAANGTYSLTISLQATANAYRDFTE